MLIIQTYVHIVNQFKVTFGENADKNPSYRFKHHKDMQPYIHANVDSDIFPILFV